MPVFNRRARDPLTITFTCGLETSLSKRSVAPAQQLLPWRRHPPGTHLPESPAWGQPELCECLPCMLGGVVGVGMTKPPGCKGLR